MNKKKDLEDEEQLGKVQKIMSIFFQPDYYTLTAPDAGGNTYLAPGYWLNQTGIALNPYGSSDSTSGWGENYGPFKSYIKNRLSILNFLNILKN